jgi:hypothetical protein
MDYGSKPADGGGLVIKAADYELIPDQSVKRYVKHYLGSDEYIEGKARYCLWISASEALGALPRFKIQEHIMKTIRDFFINVRTRLTR